MTTILVFLINFDNYWKITDWTPRQYGTGKIEDGWMTVREYGMVTWQLMVQGRGRRWSIDEEAFLLQWSEISLTDRYSEEKLC